MVVVEVVAEVAGEGVGLDVGVGWAGEVVESASQKAEVVQDAISASYDFSTSRFVRF